MGMGQIFSERKESMKVIKERIRNILLFLSVLPKVVRFIWILCWDYHSAYVHYHFAYGWDMEDLEIEWQELHKAHKVYAKKINNKYGRDLINPGKDEDGKN